MPQGTKLFPKLKEVYNVADHAEMNKDTNGEYKNIRKIFIKGNTFFKESRKPSSKNVFMVEP